MPPLQTLTQRFDDRFTALERRLGIETIVSAIDTLPPGIVETAIKRYQGVIRGNPWYFPTLQDVDLEQFIVRWISVHENYFAVAEEVMALLLSGNGSLSVLCDPRLLARVIESETMRGWVGKRSPSGLDALLENRVDELDALLTPLGPDADTVFEFGGVYTGDPTRVSAENEIVTLFTRYHTEVGQPLTVDMLRTQPNATALRLLRGFCRYSVSQFNGKYDDLSARLHTPRPQSNDMSGLVNDLVAKLDNNTRQRVLLLLEEVKALNLLNLNYEVKYSFKGWAGLMHILVIVACSDTTGIQSDVYAMRARLENGE